MVLRMAPGGVSTALETELHVNETQWGRILAMSTVGAVLGKFIGGWAADRLGGCATFAVGLLGASLGIAAFGLSSTVILFQTTFFLALMAKSFGWPGMTCMVGQSFVPSEYGRVWGILSTSSRAGSILGTLGLGALISVFSWRSVLLTAGGIGAAVALLFWKTAGRAEARLAGLRGRRGAADAASVADASEGLTRTVSDDAVASSHPLAGTTLPAALLRFAISGQFWLITISLTAMTIMWDFLLVLPRLLKDTLDMTDSGASMTASAFPWGSLVAVLAGGFLFDALDRRTTAWVMGALLLSATGCIVLFRALQQIPLTESQQVPVTVGILFIYGACIAPCYYIPMSVFSIRFGGPHVGFLVALLDAIAFGINAVFQWFGGAVAERSWSEYLFLLSSVALVSSVTMFFFLLGEAREEQAAAAAQMST